MLSGKPYAEGRRSNKNWNDKTSYSARMLIASKGKMKTITMQVKQEADIMNTTK